AHYSNIVAVRIIAPDVIVHGIYPNPATSSISYTFTSASKAKASLSIYSTSGAMLANKQISMNEGTNAVSLDITRLQPGSYYLVMADSNGMKTTTSFCKR